MDIIEAGKTIFIFSSERAHLWFVLTNPDANDHVIAVMVCSIRDFSDTTVILKEGDHPFIRHDSSVEYSIAKFLKVSKILSEMNKNKCHLEEDMSRKLLERVQKGLLDSPYIVNMIRDYCEKCFNIESNP